MGITNFLKEKFRRCLENGLDSNGIEITDTTKPSYGGNDLEEDFSGFTIYIINSDELDDPRNRKVPAILVILNVDAGNTDIHDAETELFSAEFNIVVPYTHVVDDGGTFYEKRSACDYYVDKLKEFLRKLVIHEITIMQEGQVNPFKTSDASDGKTMFWVGGASRAWEYLPGGVYGDGGI